MVGQKCALDYVRHVGVMFGCARGRLSNAQDCGLTRDRAQVAQRTKDGTQKEMAMKDDVYWMTEALALARQGGDEGEVPVGAVLVLAGERIAQAYNSPIQLHDPTAHAEVLALRRGGAYLKNYRLLDCTLYVTLEPCAMCATALVQARIARLIFGAPDPRVGAAGSAFRLTNEPRFNHQVSVSGGVLADQCEHMLRGFFRARRNN